MTPPAATAAARSHTRRPARTAAPRAPRRVSGPARAPRGGSFGGSVAVGAQGGLLTEPLGLRLARRAASLPDARLLDRLLRGRVWIACLAVGLVGIVFLQISLLKLNTGISRAVQTSQTLERQNTELKLDLSRLAGGTRIQDAAQGLGFVMPATGQPKFLDARTATAARAAAGISAPAPIQQLPLGMIPPADGGTMGVAAVTPAAGATTAALATSAPATTPAPATATGTAATAPATTATPAATPVQPAAAQAATPAPAAAAAPPPAASPPTSAAGGASPTAGG